MVSGGQEEQMRKYILTFMLVCLTGCGMSYERTRVEHGRVTIHTTANVGYASAESVEERDDPLMERCLARVGALPNAQDSAGNEVSVSQTLCTNHVVKEVNRDDEQLDDEADPYADYYRYYYGR
jgi:hypothetical protein